jgi:hypothetical protein
MSTYRAGTDILACPTLDTAYIYAHPLDDGYSPYGSSLYGRTPGYTPWNFFGSIKHLAVGDCSACVLISSYNK